MLGQKGATLMTETVMIIGTVGVLVIVLIVIFKGQKLKKVKFSKLEAEFDTGSDKSRSLVLIIDIPQRVPWLDLAMRLNGELVCEIKAKDRGGEQIVRDVVVEREGNVQYSLEATGYQRLLDSQGQLAVVGYKASGSGHVNIVYGKTFVIYEVLELGPGGAKSRVFLDSYDNYEASTLPDDIAEAEIDRIINGT